MKEIVDTDEENEPRLENYIGSTVQIHLSIQGCRHVDLSKSDGVYVMYRWLNEEMDTTTIPSMDSNKENPTLDFTKTYEFYVSQKRKWSCVGLFWRCCSPSNAMFSVLFHSIAGHT